MGDRTTADITIGGTLRRCCAAAFLGVLEGELLGPDYGGCLETVEDLAEYLEDLAAKTDQSGPPGAPCFGGHDINYGNLDEIKSFCMERGLPYVHHWDAGGEYTAGNEYWAPGDEQCQETAADQSGYPMVSLAELHAAAGKGETLTQLLERYAFADRAVPPLVLADVSAGDACPGCLAEALEPGSSDPDDYPGNPEAA